MKKIFFPLKGFPRGIFFGKAYRKPMVCGAPERHSFAGFSGKGFLGPIGDDLPSLIPLIFALIVFFSVFYSANQAFDRKTSVFEDDITLMQIGNSLRSTGFISGYPHFSDLCNSLNVRRVKFVAGLVDYIEFREREGKQWHELDPNTIFSEGFEFFGAESPEEGQVKFVCTNVPAEGRWAGFPVIPAEKENVVTRTYSVVLDFGEFRDPKLEKPSHYVKPMLLVIAAWRA